jgi:hypothetical protein
LLALKGLSEAFREQLREEGGCMSEIAKCYAASGMKTWLAVALLMASFAQAGDGLPLVVNERVTKDFIHCGESKEMRALVEALMASDKAREKTDSYFSFPIKGTVLGLPFSELWIGVCNKTGERGCGWGVFRSFTIDMPLAKANARLKSRYGVDFTVAKRDNEADATERPILTTAKSGNATVLYCDSGSL